MADAQWETHKAQIKYLYLTKDKKLEEVMEFMKRTHGFHKTKNQYTARLRKWRFKKYRMGALKWKYVNRQMQKRAAEGKGLEVWMNGIRYSQKTVQFEIHRQGFQTEIEKHRRDPSPPTPEGLIVCSPGPSVLQLTWPTNLPWFIFSNIALSRIHSPTDSSSVSLAHLSGVHKEKLPAQMIERNLVKSLASLMTGNHAEVLRTGRSSSSVATALSLIMPEQYDGHNTERAEHLCGLRGDSDVADRFQVALFWATAYALAHKLFASAVRSQDIETVRMALKAGIDPDTPVLHERHPLPPLVVASSFKDFRVSLDMCNLLISYGYGAKNIENLESALSKAICSGNVELIKRFLLQNVPISGNALKDAISRGTPDILSMLLAVDPNVNKRIDDSRLTLLGFAVDRTDISLVKYLLRLGADVDALQPVWPQVSPSKSTTLGLAVRVGNDEMIDILLKSNANINHQDISVSFLPPLVVSIEHQSKKITSRLLSAGADVKMCDMIQGETLVQRALKRKDSELASLLISYGARAKPALMEDCYTSILYQNVKMNNIDMVVSLLNWGARKNEIYDRVPDTILGAAIAHGHCGMIKLLLEAGVANLGRRLIKIGNLKTAEYLEELGLLAGILHRYGQPILVPTIKQAIDDDGLVEYLLDRNVDQQPRDVGRQPYHVRIESSDILPLMTLGLNDVYTSPLEAAISSDIPDSLSIINLLVERGAPITDLELASAVRQYRIQTDSFETLRLFLDKLSQHPCAAPNAFAEAFRSDSTVFLVDRFLEIGLNPRGKAFQQMYAANIFWYQLHGITEDQTLDSVLEEAVRCDDESLRTILHAQAWTAVEKGRALTMGLFFGEEDHGTGIIGCRGGCEPNRLCGREPSKAT